jgi:hypothetical protein
MERGSWDDPCACATRGLRRPSLDSRSWDHPSHPLVSDRSLRPCLGQGASRRARIWAGEKSEHFEHPVGLFFWGATIGFSELANGKGHR